MKFFQNIRNKVLRDEGVRFFLGSFFILFSVLLFASFVSFFLSWKNDQSEMDVTFIDYLFDIEIKTENIAGKIGAFFSEIFIHYLIGIAAFVVPFMMFIFALRFFRTRLLPLRKTFRYSIVTALIISAVSGYLFEGSFNSNIGGLHGYYLNRWLVSLLGKIGTGFFLLMVVFGFLIYSFKGFVPFLKSLFETNNLNINPEVQNNSDKAEDIESQETSVEENNIVDEKIEENIENSDEDVENENSEIVTEEENFEEETVVQESETQAKIDTSDIDFEVEDHHNSEGEDSKNISSNINNQDSEEQMDLIDVRDDAIPLAVTNLGEELEQAEKVSQEVLADYDPTLELSHYKLPAIELLIDHKSENSEVTEEELIENKNKIIETLGNYKIQIVKIKATIGPTVTLYEIIPAPGIRISKIKNLEDDIALSLAALGIRIIAPIPGKGTIGIEVPNKNPEVVSMRSVIGSTSFQETKADLPLALGKTITNDTFVVDLAKMPHLLIAGATGQGKSVGLNAIISSLLYKKHPAQLKFVMVDPKKVELTLYSKIEKHFLAKLPDEEKAIITDTQKVVNTLNSLCSEMDERYRLLEIAETKEIKEYNAKFIKRKLNPDNGHRYLPYIVVIIDEFADLIMTAGKEVELPLARLAQLARAIGIHLVIATQRPTTNIITGVIKANFPARIAFRVTSSIDSRTILDTPGANQLIGKGDMLFMSGSELKRLQCAFLESSEIASITEFISKQQSYGSAFLLPEYSKEGEETDLEVDLGKRDSLFEDAARLIVSAQQGSTSLVQRKFSIGYNRAGRIIDQLEAAHIVGPFEGSKARQVLITDLNNLEQLLKNIE